MVSLVNNGGKSPSARDQVYPILLKIHVNIAESKLGIEKGCIEFNGTLSGPSLPCLYL